MIMIQVHCGVERGKVTNYLYWYMFIRGGGHQGLILPTSSCKGRLLHCPSFYVDRLAWCIEARVRGLKKSETSSVSEYSS